MQVPDPDIMYEGEGVQVMESAYEGLVRYKSGTAQIIPRSGEVVDGLAGPTDIHVHAAARREVPRRDDRRRRSVDQELRASREDQPGPGLHGRGGRQDRGAGPDDVRRHAQGAEQRVPSLPGVPWQPFAVSPTAVAKNAVGDDMAQEWLKTHDAGTGPYIFKEFVTGSHYTLEAFPDYWGEKPRIQIRFASTSRRASRPRSCSWTPAHSTW